MPKRCRYRPSDVFAAWKMHQHASSGAHLAPWTHHARRSAWLWGPCTLKLPNSCTIHPVAASSASVSVLRACWCHWRQLETACGAASDCLPASSGAADRDALQASALPTCKHNTGRAALDCCRLPTALRHAAAVDHLRDRMSWQDCLQHAAGGTLFTVGTFVPQTAMQAGLWAAACTLRHSKLCTCGEADAVQVQVSHVSHRCPTLRFMGRCQGCLGCLAGT